MSFLAPWAIGLFAIVGPVLVVLYLLKLRRRREYISSTFLWKKATKDLEVNAPFQRLRRNLLLLLQLIVLALIVLALARPTVESTVSTDESVILILDRSASMNTVEADGQTRFELARDQCERYARSLNQGAGGWRSIFTNFGPLTRVMVITFDERARVVAPFTTNTSDVAARIRELTPTDKISNLREALELAEAYMTQTRIEQTPEPSQTPSRVVVFSDGAIASLDGYSPRADRVSFVPIGSTRDNVGITRLRAQRNYEEPELVNVFVSVENFGDQPIRSDVTLFVNKRIRSVETVELAPARRRSVAEPDDSPVPESVVVSDDDRRSGTALSFSFPLGERAVVEARLSRDDALATDDSAWIVIPPPRKLRVRLVTERNFFLENVLRHLPVESVDIMTPEEYAAAGDERLADGAASNVDVVIFDKFRPKRLFEGNHVFISSAPELPEWEVGEDTPPHGMLWWDETHPTLRHVPMEYVVVAKSRRITVPDSAQRLIEGPHGPVLVRWAGDGRHIAVLSFAIEDSNFWSKPGFPVFMYNLVRFMGGAAQGGDAGAVQAGSALRVNLGSADATATLERPDGASAKLLADSMGIASYAGTDIVGIYRTSGDVGDVSFAVNLASAIESDIAVRETLDLGAGVFVETEQQIATSTPEIWRWFLAAALVMAMLEWYIFLRRVRA